MDIGTRVLVVGVVVALLGVACGPDDAAPPPEPASTQDEPAAAPEPAPDTPAPEPEPEPDPEPSAADGEREDLLSYGAGAFPIRYDPDTQFHLSRLLLDGIPGYGNVSDDPEGPDEPLVLTVELPALTTFDTFGVPPMSSFGCCSGTHIATVTVEGSSTSPDTGFEQLVTFDVAPEVYDADQLFPAAVSTPVRWVRVTLEGRQVPDPDDYRGTSFTDLRGFGTQDERPTEDGQFSGIFLTGGGAGGGDGNRIELIQDGALVTGCRVSGGAVATISGGIENGILKITAPDGVATLAVVNSEGQLTGAEIGRSYTRIIGDPGGNPTVCSPLNDGPPNPIAEALEAGTTAIVYGINFDVDSDVLRPDAEPALRQLLDALTAHPEVSVTIEGHTDSDGSDAHNLDLSQRRAESVVAWLTDQDIDGSRLTAIGLGEDQPIADNESSAGKAANRRVEVEATA